MKLLFLTAIAVFSLLNVNAQTVPTLPTQNLWIDNQLECDIYYNVYAHCPDDPCNVFSSKTMHQLGSGQVQYNPPGAFTFLDNNSNTMEPPCSDWEWIGAEVDIICNGNVYHFVFGPGIACPPFVRMTQSWTPPAGCCGDRPIEFSLSLASNGVTLFAKYQ